MKGVEPLIAAVLVIMISIVGIVIVLETSQPSIDRMGEIALLNEAKDIMNQIDTTIGSVRQGDEGSTRVIDISVSGGRYVINSENETIIFSMDSMSQIVGVGVSNTEGNLAITGERGKVFIELTYPGSDINNDVMFSTGHHRLVIRNSGYDFDADKQKLNITINS